MQISLYLWGRMVPTKITKPLPHIQNNGLRKYLTLLKVIRFVWFTNETYTNMILKYISKIKIHYYFSLDLVEPHFAAMTAFNSVVLSSYQLFILFGSDFHPFFLSRFAPGSSSCLDVVCWPPQILIGIQIWTFAKPFTFSIFTTPQNSSALRISLY